MSRMKRALVGRSSSRVGLSRRTQAGLLTLVATAATVFGTATPSMADGDQYWVGCESASSSCQTGVKVSYPAGVCTTASSYYGSTAVCIDYYGDWVYVKDGDADGFAAMAHIEADAGVRDRYCRNPHTAGTWARCHFDWSESARKEVSGGTLQNYATMPLDYLWSFSNN
ncbi:hypothetical protein AB0J86_26640 [Micromonospora sp. NPDC049559]|uniref:hypothetical protein n=1 Tax=Micromonospora sp. NPDC049559 TaxID=3155923 RepID=UPI00343E3005